MTTRIVLEETGFGIRAAVLDLEDRLIEVRDADRDDPRVTELALIIIQDLYDNKGLNEKVSGNIRRMVDDFSTQIRMELRREAEDAV